MHYIVVVKSVAADRAYAYENAEVMRADWANVPLDPGENASVYRGETATDEHELVDPNDSVYGLLRGE